MLAGSCQWHSSQWRCQRSKGARSFRGQKILQPGHPDALFPQKSKRPFLVVALKTQAANAVNKAVRYGNVFIFCSHYYRSKTVLRARQGQGLSQVGGSSWRTLV